VQQEALLFYSSLLRAFKAILKDKKYLIFFIRLEGRDSVPPVFFLLAQRQNHNKELLRGNRWIRLRKAMGKTTLRFKGLRMGLPSPYSLTAGAG
jgi:hypothetical protein